MPESALGMSLEQVSVYMSGVLGLLLSTFPDELAFHTSLRMLCLSCFTTLFFVLILAFIVFRSALNSIKTFVSLVVIVSWSLLFPLNWSDLFSRFMKLEYSKWALLITFVIVLVMAVVIICLWDQPQNTNYLRSITVVFFLSGCGFCAFALKSLLLGFAIPCLIQLSRFLLPFKLTTGSFKFFKHMIPKQSAREVKNQSFPTVDESMSLTSETMYTEDRGEHPLVQQGLIINPKTNRIITIGLKTYNELLDMGYTPDFKTGELHMKNSIL